MSQVVVVRLAETAVTDWRCSHLLWTLEELEVEQELEETGRDWRSARLGLVEVELRLPRGLPD